MRIKLDHYAHASTLQKVHPAEKLLFALCCLVAVLTAPGSIVQTCLFLAISLVVIYIGQIPLTLYLKLLMIPGAFIGLSLIGICLEVVVTGQGLSLGISDQGLAQAYSYFIKALAATGAMYFLILTTPITDILAVFRSLRVPEILLDLLSLTYHFIFVLLEVVSEITTSQDARLGYSSLKVSLKSLSLLVSQLLIRTLHRASQLQQSLEARGYTGKLEVLTPVNSPSWGKLMLISVLGFVLISINIIGVG